MKDNVEHLGDGLYASFDGYQICLMANSPTEPTDTVYLDPSVYANLLEYVKRLTVEEPDCPNCRGDGLLANTMKTWPCPVCKGTGKQRSATQT